MVLGERYEHQQRQTRVAALEYAGRLLPMQTRPTVGPPQDSQVGEGEWPCKSLSVADARIFLAQLKGSSADAWGPQLAGTPPVA